MADFDIGFTPEQTLALAQRALECFGAPEQLPRRPPAALEPDAYWDRRRNGGGAEDADMVLTALWLQRRDECRQRNKAALGALLWACRQLVDVVPESQRGTLGRELVTALISEWGCRADVPRTLADCRQLSEAYGTARWADVGQTNRRAA